MSGDIVLLLGADQLLLGVTIWILAMEVRSARGRSRRMAEQATRQRGELEFQVHSAIKQEQAQMARELHDVVAHHLTVIVAGASAAKRMTESGESASALATIETVGREALVELRLLLGRLHAEQDELSPPGLDQLPVLMARVQHAGLPVLLTVQGDRRPLPHGVETNAYRIIQEALTNVLKHAGPTTAGVLVGYRPGSLRLHIHDEGGGGSGFFDGHGLRGMRQRAAQLGGRIAVGPGPEGGFQVAVDLPVESG
jgi:signal transduction histidine kinase